jgi:hypothetical protein
MTGQPSGPTRQPSGPTRQPGTAATSGPREAAGPARRTAGWRASLPELLIALVLVVATTGTAYFYSGPAAAAVTLTGWTVAILALLRFLVPTTPRPLLDPQEWRTAGQGSFIGFWRKRGVLSDATSAMASYDYELRPVLQHLLAARLAERHGVNLYRDPAAARRLLLAGRRDEQLWFWLDPERPAEAARQPGIPPRTLAVIIDRLERL